MAMIDSDQHIYHFKKLAEAAHQEGKKIVIEINHAGRQTSSSITGSPIVAPSVIPCPVRREMPKQLSHEEIQKLSMHSGPPSRVQKRREPIAWKSIWPMDI